MRGFRPYIFLIISIALFWFSCKKENDTFPSISQIKVNQSGSYKFGDTIIVQVTIKDVDGPVRISILKGAQSRPLPTELFSSIMNLIPILFEYKLSMEKMVEVNFNL